MDNAEQVATLAREAIANLTSEGIGITLNSSRVGILYVNSTSSNATVWQAFNASAEEIYYFAALNASSPANEGLYTAPSSDYLWSNPTSHGNNARRLTSSLRAVSYSRTLAATQPSCAAVRQLGSWQTVTTTIRFVIIADALLMPNGTDTAMTTANALSQGFQRERSTQSAFSRFVSAWSNCTGAPTNVSQLLTLIEQPTVVSMPSPSSMPVSAAVPVYTASEGGLPAGGIAGIVIAVLVSSCCCCLAFCCWRRRKDKKEEEEEGRKKERLDAAFDPVVIDTKPTTPSSPLQMQSEHNDASGSTEADRFDFINPLNDPPAAMRAAASFLPVPTAADAAHEVVVVAVLRTCVLRRCPC